LLTAMLCSLIMQLVNFPSHIIAEWAFKQCALDSINPFYCLNATLIIAQGVCLYRMLEAEHTGKQDYDSFILAIFVQSLIIFVFAAFQFAFDMPPWRELMDNQHRGLSSPFDDLNASGSSIVMLFSLFVFHAREGQLPSRILNGVVAMLLLLYASLTLSRITIITAMLVLMFWLWQTLKQKINKALLIFSLAANILLFAVIVKPGWRIPFTRTTLSTMLSTGSLQVRTFMWENAAAIIAAAPLFGNGIGTYRKAYSHSTFSIGENAHNYFIQLFSDLGAAGMIIFAGIIFYVFYEMARSWGKIDPEAKLYCKGIAAGIAGFLVTCVTGHPLLLPAQQFMFWFFVAGAAAAWRTSAGDSELRQNAKVRVVTAIVLVLVIAGYGYQGYGFKNSIGYEYGFYPYENMDGGLFRWSGKEASVCVRAKTDLFRVNLVTHPANTDGMGLNLKIYVNRSLLDEKNITAAGKQQIYCYAPGITGNTVNVTFVMDRTFNPYRLGQNNDNRDLGAAFFPMEFLKKISQKGIGFYHWETLGEGLPSGWPPGKPLRFRWTGMQAAMAIPQPAHSRGLELFVVANHPDVTAMPVVVTILGDGQSLKTIKFTEIVWQKITLPAHDLAGKTVLEFRVSRTWNPKASGISGDNRTLGIAVAIPDL
ncbi:MAG: O-antigen ligase family protein, partial [Proteobacteria bacterium]|nr:O-antigen ligase family protein [Pseudomonadota bacterium]